MTKKSFIALGIIAVMVFGMISCVNSRKSDEIKIGAILPLTGDAAIYGKSLQNGLQVALDEYNSKQEKKISIVFEDSKAEPKLAVNAINKLISTDKIQYIIGDMFTNTTLAIAPIAQQNRILLLSPTGSSNEISKVGDYVFRIYPSETEEGNALGDFFNKNFYGQKAFIACANEDAMKNVALSIKKKLGATITEEDYNTNSSSFIPVITKIPSDVNVVFALGYMPDISLFVRQSQELKRDYVVAGLSTLYDNKFIELIANSSIEVFLTASSFSPDSKDDHTQRFVELYHNRYKEQPNVWAGYGYDAFNILAQSISEANAKGENTTTVLENLKDYEGVTGLTTINKDHSINKTFDILQIKDGKFTIAK